nr:MAG TPA: hypothetical protein [Inoviridae sp.]
MPPPVRSQGERGAGVSLKKLTLLNHHLSASNGDLTNTKHYTINYQSLINLRNVCT